MTEKLTLLFRAQIIADSFPRLSQDGVRYKRLLALSLQQLTEAVDDAIAELKK